MGMSKLTILANLDALRSPYAEVRTLAKLFQAYVESTLSKKELEAWEARTRSDLQPAYPMPNPSSAPVAVFRAQNAPPAEMYSTQINTQPPNLFQPIGQPAAGQGARFDPQGGLIEGVVQHGNATVQVRPPPNYAGLAGAPGAGAPPMMVAQPPAGLPPAAQAAIDELEEQISGKKKAELVKVAEERGLSVQAASQMSKADLIKLLVGAHRHEIEKAVAAGEYAEPPATDKPAGD